MGNVDTATDQRRQTKDAPQKFIKAVYREYVDSTYSVPKKRPLWAGIQGPVIRARAGDRLVVHFKNLAAQPYSISPVGITYSKQSEGAGYDDSTAGQEKEDDAVSPGGYYKYVWDIRPQDGPTASDPECLTYSYSSQVDTVRDFNSGLVGALLICKSTALTPDGERKSTEFVLLFAVFDESKSWYGEVGERRMRERFKRSSAMKQYHTINGYVNSTLPGLTMCQRRYNVFWHLIGMGTAPQIHSIQFQDHNLQVMAHRKVTMEMTPMTFTSAEMRPSVRGRFLISCRIHSHRDAGMRAVFTVDDCPDPIDVPGPDLRNVKNREEEPYEGDYREDYSHGDKAAGLFSAINIRPVKPQGRSGGGRWTQTRVHYVAAEEVTWDYTPHLKPTDRKLMSEYFPANPQRLGYRYKKVVYVEYNDISFTQKKNHGNRLMGPLLKGQIGDKIHVIFRNLASRPYNIYPNGLTQVHPIRRSQLPELDLRTLAVPPNGTFGYEWRLTAEDGPLEGDPQCLTLLYQGTINPERDLASGLVGPLLVCKEQAIDTRGRLVGPDKEKTLMFGVFDENQSWYMTDNIQKYSPKPSLVNPSDPDFYKSNIIYSVNGLMFNGREFLICQNDVTFWHVANVGMQSDFLSVYFTGNSFQRDDVYESVLTLFPMTGETVPMETELIGEWEISAFDGGLKNLGMTVRYTVRPCDNGVDLPLVEKDDYEEDLSDYLDQLLPMGPRGTRPQNRSVAVRVCKKNALNATSAGNGTDNDLGNDVAGVGGQAGEPLCEIRHVTVASSEGDANMVSDEGIPLDVLRELEQDGEWSASLSPGGRLGAGPGSARRRRGAGEEEGHGGSEAGGVEKVGGMEEGRGTTDLRGGNTTESGVEVDVATTRTGGEGSLAGAGGEVEVTTAGIEANMIEAKGTVTNMIGTSGTRTEGGASGTGAGVEGSQAPEKAVRPPGGTVAGRVSSGAGPGGEERGGPGGEAQVEGEDSNEILMICDPQPTAPSGPTQHGQELGQDLQPVQHVQSKAEPLTLDSLAVDNVNDTADNKTQGMSLSEDYDDYSEEENSTFGTLGEVDPRNADSQYRSYYIAAEEITWDYGIKLPHQLIKPREMRRGMRKFLGQYKKVVYRAYRDRDFLVPDTRGELQDHLGLLGPIIRAEVNDLLTVTFKNMASRPFSLHLHGVYDRSQGTGSFPGPGSPAQAGVPGEAVPPGEVRVYSWRVTRRQGPTDGEFDCKAGAYYSTVNQERDLHSGLVGPLVICKPGTLHPRLHLQPGIQEYALLFHTFDESRSWYMEENLERYCTPPCRPRPRDLWFQVGNRFAAINGYVAETLPGLLVAQHELVRWHLLNVGAAGEYHAVHFHGLPFNVHTEEEHRMGVFNLYPGVFGTVEMHPPTVGTWLVECTVGDHQLAGMRAKLLVYSHQCVLPLGMKSGRIDDSQITASDHIGNWEPRLARLDLSGSVNAWMGNDKTSWIQVDLQRPTLLHGLQTQGARSTLRDFFIMHFTLSYSLDLDNWSTYRGNSTKHSYIFFGNTDGSRVRDNRLFPPIVARYIKLQPINIQRNPVLRLELLGCDLNSCSLPLGLQRRLIPDSSFSASSYHSSWLHTWSPALARLNQEGSSNAWRPKINSPHEWLQVDFLRVQRLTGVMTQGAKSLLTQMMVTEFAVSVSDNGHTWVSVQEEDTQREKVFIGNNEPDEEALTTFDPPLFGRFLRIHPRGWVNDIALRLEVLGCDTQQRL
ncbi:coagulation factor VIII [Aplochiton taeniatus]